QGWKTRHHFIFYFISFHATPSTPPHLTFLPVVVSHFSAASTSYFPTWLKLRHPLKSNSKSTGERYSKNGQRRRLYRSFPLHFLRGASRPFTPPSPKRSADVDAVEDGKGGRGAGC